MVQRVPLSWASAVLWPRDTGCRSLFRRLLHGSSESAPPCLSPNAPRDPQNAAPHRRCDGTPADAGTVLLLCSKVSKCIWSRLFLFLIAPSPFKKFSWKAMFFYVQNCWRRLGAGDQMNVGNWKSQAHFKAKLFALRNKGGIWCIAFRGRGLWIARFSVSISQQWLIQWIWWHLQKYYIWYRVQGHIV